MQVSLNRTLIPSCSLENCLIMNSKIIAFLLICIFASMLTISEAQRSSICYQPLKGGKCLALFQRWGYHPRVGKCVQFTYGGCDANDNNFQTEQECKKSLLRALNNLEVRISLGLCSHRTTDPVFFLCPIL